MANALATSEARLLSGRDIMYPESVDRLDSRLGELTTTPGGGAPIGAGGGGGGQRLPKGGQGGTPPHPKSTCKEYHQSDYCCLRTDAQQIVCLQICSALLGSCASSYGPRRLVAEAFRADP